MRDRGEETAALGDGGERWRGVVTVVVEWDRILERSLVSKLQDRESWLWRDVEH